MADSENAFLGIYEFGKIYGEQIEKLVSNF